MLYYLLIGRGTPERPRIVLVFFLGGVTYAEISALRFLSQREDGMKPSLYITNYVHHYSREFSMTKFCINLSWSPSCLYIDTSIVVLPTPQFLLEGASIHTIHSESKSADGQMLRRM